MAGFGCFMFAAVIAISCLAIFVRVDSHPFYRHYTDSSDFGRDGNDHEVNFVHVFKAVRPAATYVLCAGVATTSSALVYPAATSLVTPMLPDDSAWHRIYFSQVCCFLTWNIGNYAGTATAGVLQWPYGTSINSQVTCYFKHMNDGPNLTMFVIYVGNPATAGLAEDSVRAPLDDLQLGAHRSRPPGHHQLRLGIHAAHVCVRLLRRLQCQHGHDVWPQGGLRARPGDRRRFPGRRHHVGHYLWCYLQYSRCSGSITT